MRLAVFLTWDVSLEIWREKGLLQREVKLYQKLAAEGVEVVLFSWGGAADADIARAYPEFTVVPLYTRMPRHDSKALRALSSLAAPFLVRGFLTPDTVLKTNQMWGAWVAVIAKFLYRKELILRTGYELFDFTLRGPYGLARKMFIWALSLACYKSADAVFCATPSDRDFIRRHFNVAEDRITLCPNWIDTEMFRPDEGVLRDNALLSVGRLNAQKNLPALIGAAGRTPFPLQIVGTGEMEGALKTQAAGLDVNFSGSVPNDALPQLYRTCGLYVLPSFYEGNPKTLLEAMACGAPVLGTDVPGIRDVVEHGVTGFLCQTDEDSIAKAIKTLMADPALRESLGKAAREAIVANNTLAAQVAREVRSLQILTQGK